MVFYECKCCMFTTGLKSNYESHLITKKHLKLVQNRPNITQNIAKISPISNTFSCKYCSQGFKHKSSIYKHIKYTCTKSKDEDLKELVRLMNLKMDQKDKELDLHKKTIETQFKQLETQSKQIDKLVNKLEIHGSFNTTNIQNNIQLLSFKDTDVSHLTDKDYAFCIKRVNFCVKSMIEKIHFNPAKPENMNIYISNLKDKYLMVYENGNWNIKTKKELDYLYEQKEMMLEEWINEQDKYPELKEKFIQYVHNKDNDETLNMIKDEIKLMMYNKRLLLE
jgi:hypothetical protein